MRLLLTRHGETIENKKGIIQGQTHGTLSRLGKIQARKIALRLKNEKIDVIYSSDLKRSADTAKEIAKYHPHVPIYFVKELREMYFGSHQGKHRSKVKFDDDSAGIESFSDIRKRTKAISTKAYKKYPDKNVLFVSHGGPIRALITLFENKRISFMKKIEKIDNTSLTIYHTEDNKIHTKKLFNCTKHLD